MGSIVPEDILGEQPGTGQVAIWWLGQAGFLLKSADRPVIAVDPYLSDSCAISHGLARRIPIPIAPSRLPADLVLVSHWHPDHLDPETIRSMRQRRQVHIVGPSSCIRRCRLWGVPDERLHTLNWGERFSYMSATITAVVARHMVPGALCEDANGYLIDLGGIRFYHTGDTEYDVRLRKLERAEIDVMLTCFVGIGRMLDAQEAAWLASRVRPSLLVPMHFGMFDYSDEPWATDDPSDLIRVYRRLVDQPQVVVPQMGRPIIVDG